MAKKSKKISLHALIAESNITPGARRVSPYNDDADSEEYQSIVIYDNENDELSGFSSEELAFFGGSVHIRGGSDYAIHK